MNRVAVVAMRFFYIEEHTKHERSKKNNLHKFNRSNGLGVFLKASIIKGFHKGELNHES